MPSEFHLLIAEAREFSPAAAARLRQVGRVTLADLERSQLLQHCAAADVLWVRLRHRIDAEVMAAAPRLRFIATPTTGLNHIDLAAAEQRGIQVLSLRGETEFLKDVRATAEQTLGLLLALLRHTPAAAASAARGEWNRDRFRGNELYGKTAGVIGYGRLGRIVAQYLQAFGMRVLVTDPHVEAASVAPGLELVSQAALLAQADVVTLHVNLTPATTGFFGPAAFAALKPGAWFINTARGELIDEPSLLAALQTERLAGAALDVVSSENAAGMPDHPLIQYARAHSNLLLTPHLGGCTQESMEKTELFLAEKVCRAWQQTNAHSA
jgi:D-3-phosphoglycerate dehydrogenase